MYPYMCQVLHKQVPKYICESHFQICTRSSETDLARSCVRQLASLTHSLDLCRRSTIPITSASVSAPFSLLEGAYVILAYHVLVATSCAIAVALSMICWRS